MATNENRIFLDLAIKEYETNGEKKGTFYKMDDGRQYENYIDNDSWKVFVGKMKDVYPSGHEHPSAYDQYKKGSGGELKPWSYKGKQYPPKMASYGSSSRMIYLLSKKIDGFEFEKQIPTTIGRGKANLDGYLFRDGTHYYIEAKRREPYDNKSNKVSWAYKTLYDYITDDASVDFRCECPDESEKAQKKDMNVRFFVGDQKIHRFDIKQAICHLLAIANENLKNRNERIEKNEKTTFLYLLYNPCEVMEYIPPENREDICRIYREEKEECGRIPFEKLYRTILQYLGGGDVPKKEIDRISKNFTFRLCDQFEYGEIVNPSSVQKQ